MVGLGFNPGFSRSQGGGDAPFSPSDIPDLGLDLRAYRGIGLNGSNVAQWDDFSGEDRHVAQSDPTRQPLFSGSGPTAKVALDGSNDFLFNDMPFLFDSGECTVFMVANVPTQSNGRFFAAETNSGNNQGNNVFKIFRQGSGGGDATYNQCEWFNSAGSGNSTKFGDDPCWDGNTSIYTIVDTGSLLTQYRDGVAAPSTDSYTRSGTTTLNRFVLGAFHGAFTEHYGQIDLYAFLGYGRALTSDERLQVEDFLRDYYGTP